MRTSATSHGADPSAAAGLSLGPDASSVAGAAVGIEDVTRIFRGRRRSPFRPAPEVRALDGVTLTIPHRSRFGVVGESGSGKTTLMRLIAALDRPTSGRVIVDGTDLTGLAESQLRPLRRSLQMVFQDPMGSLDPTMRIGSIVAEALDAQRRRAAVDPGPVSEAARRRDAIREIVSRALVDVGLEPDAATRYPHQFSGGQRQRIAIARAIAPEPSIVIADEAVSALDVTVRAQILTLLTDLANNRQMTLIFVAHDLSVVRRVCDQVAVMRRGRVVESGPVERIFDEPAAAYTEQLLRAAPTLAGALARARERRAVIPAVRRAGESEER